MVCTQTWYTDVQTKITPLPHLLPEGSFPKTIMILSLEFDSVNIAGGFSGLRGVCLFASAPCPLKCVGGPLT